MTRSILLDTNALLWLLDQTKNHNIGKKSQHLITSSVLYVSPISVTEMHIKHMVGKLKATNITREKLTEANIRVLPYDSHHAERFTDFQSLARHDPFDRMLLAQALAEDMLFMTADKVLLNMNLHNVVDASV